MPKAKITQENLDECRGILPFRFIDGLQLCLDSGFSPDQITAILVLLSGWKAMTREMTDGEAIRRAVGIVRSITGAGNWGFTDGD